MKSPPILNGVLSMPSKLLKIIILIILCLAISFGTYKFCYFVAEKYFFDKFFYQKSINHGYWLKNTKISDFGIRSKDIIALENNDHQILDTDNKSFKIAIIGDSYVWGQGLRNNQRFSVILEKKLNKIRPTRVYSLAQSGWNATEYLNIYKKMISILHPNLIIFSLYTNDIFIKKTDKSNTIINNCLKINPEIQPTTDIDEKEYPLLSTNEINKKTAEKELFSWTNTINLCVINQIFEVLPSKNSIYFITTDYNDDIKPYQIYKNILKLTNKYILSTSKGKNIQKYKQYWKELNPWKYFPISFKETHPNALANQMYADILFNEITTNPRWGF